MKRREFLAHLAAITAGLAVARTPRAETLPDSAAAPDTLPARAPTDTTAHAPSPGWMEVDKEALRARITGQPRRDELVQIQLNEQLIVELYSK